MSIVEITPTCPQCDDSAASCSTCGGYLGWPNPPNNITLGPCKKCVEGIAAAAINGQAAALANPAAVRAAWMMTQGFAIDKIVESLCDAPPIDLVFERSQLDAAIHARDFAPEPIAIGDEISLEDFVDDEATRPLTVLTDIGGPLTIVTAPAVHAYEGSPTLSPGTTIHSWRGLGSDLLTMLGRLAADRGDERANQVALLLHKMLRDEVSH